VFVLIGIAAPVAFVAAFFFLAVVGIDALAEPLVMAKSIDRFFFRHGVAGRVLSLFFTPGWVSASWYVALVALLGGGLLAVQGQFDDDNRTLAYLAFLGALLFPAALIRLFKPSTKRFLGFYIGLQFFLSAVTLLIAMMSELSGQPLFPWICPIPISVFLLNLVGLIKPDQTAQFLLVTALVTATCLGILLVRTLTPLRDIRAALAQPSLPDA